MKTLSIVLVIFLLSNICYSQQNIPCLSKVLKTCIDLYDNNVLALQASKPDSIVVTNDFDFSSFEKIKCYPEARKCYELSYKGQSIQQIERIDSINDLYSYKFAVFKKDGIIYLFGIGGGDFLKGVIVILENLKSLFYIQLSDQEINKNSTFYRVPYIMKLNGSLSPLYKVHFYKEYISYITDIRHREISMKVPLEKMYFPLIDCLTLSSSIKTFRDLEKLYLNKEYFYLLGSVEPSIRDYSIPLWLYGNYPYK